MIKKRILEVNNGDEVLQCTVVLHEDNYFEKVIVDRSVTGVYVIIGFTKMLSGFDLQVVIQDCFLLGKQLRTKGKLKYVRKL